MASAGAWQVWPTSLARNGASWEKAGPTGQQDQSWKGSKECSAGGLPGRTALPGHQGLSMPALVAWHLS